MFLLSAIYRVVLTAPVCRAATSTRVLDYYSNSKLLGSYFTVRLLETSRFRLLFSLPVIVIRLQSLSVCVKQIMGTLCYSSLSLACCRLADCSQFSTTGSCQPTYGLDRHQSL